MGSKASKPVQAATRKFPSRAPGSAPPPTSFSRPAAEAAWNPTAVAGKANSDRRAAAPRASLSKNDAIKQDAMDPNPITDAAFSQRLRQMGIATPNPTMSNSSTASPIAGSSPHAVSSRSPLQQNTTLNALDARRRVQESFDIQSQTPSAGREYVDVGVLRQILMMRDRGFAAPDIEKRLRLKSGVVARVGSPGVIEPLSL
ncbi:hypothetical protein PG996_005715 [Apiospora saccharicola]|uniref:Helix-turn-helix domain-containing protein n=1 Tax=Apiospora saccharicola TaxID=335842 RepID=A0ABR1VNC5_9PEZI